jgi:hypothetical protein
VVAILSKNSNKGLVPGGGKRPEIRKPIFNLTNTNMSKKIDAYTNSIFIRLIFSIAVAAIKMKVAE